MKAWKVACISPGLTAGAGARSVGLRRLAHTVQWQEADGTQRSAAWRSETVPRPPEKVLLVDEDTTARKAHKVASLGHGLLWRGKHYPRIRALMDAVARRINKQGGSHEAEDGQQSLLEFYRAQRAQRSLRRSVLNKILIDMKADHTVDLRRSPHSAEACAEVLGPCSEPYVLPVTDLQAFIGAHEWRKKGMPVKELQGRRIHPHYGVFTPTRNEYISLVASARLPPGPARFESAVDVGTGTGVLAALLAQRGLTRVVGTDTSDRALVCARENVERLGVAGRVEVLRADVFVPGLRTHIALCNPPWLPLEREEEEGAGEGALGGLDAGVYDPGSRLLQRFVGGLREHLLPGGEGWLVMSDLAERIGLRPHGELQRMFEGAGLRVLGQSKTKPDHKRSKDESDALHEARSGEIVSLWRLGVKA